VGPRGGLDDLEKRKFLTLRGLELRRLSRPARSQSLYRLCYPGSCFFLHIHRIILLPLVDPKIIVASVIIHTKRSRRKHECYRFSFRSGFSLSFT
jgi:hypothetical protein